MTSRLFALSLRMLVVIAALPIHSALGATLEDISLISPSTIAAPAGRYEAPQPTGALTPGHLTQAWHRRGA
jgi:hypothetical protein